MKNKIITQLKHDYGQYLTSVNGSTLTMKPPHSDYILTMKVKAWDSAYTVGITTLKHGAIRTKDHTDLDELIVEVRKALYFILKYNPERRENENA